MSQNMSLVGGVSYSSCAGYQILNSLYQVDVSGVNPNGVNENLVQDSAGLWYMTDRDTSDKNICRNILPVGAVRRQSYIQQRSGHDSSAVYTV
jgi:hypothetical protein